MDKIECINPTFTDCGPASKDQKYFSRYPGKSIYIDETVGNFERQTRIAYIVCRGSFLSTNIFREISAASSQVVEISTFIDILVYVMNE